MIHLWLVDFQEISEGGAQQTLAYTFSFELPQHEMYTMDDLIPGEMLVLVYDHNLSKICLTILRFPDVGLLLDLDNALKFQVRIMSKCQTRMIRSVLQEPRSNQGPRCYPSILYLPITYKLKTS